MATKQEFVEYVADQLREMGVITYKPMFGEYGVYCDGKIAALACDDQLFVKITPAGLAAFPDLPQAPPYEGAKPYFLVEDIDDRDTLVQLMRITVSALPGPKRRKS